MNQLIENLRPYALLIARVIAGYMFLLHGTAKFFEFPVSMTGGNGAVAFFSIYGAAAVLELVGGIFIILGLFTRLTAFILSGQMAVAYFMFHASAETLFQPMLNKGELAALYSLFFLVLIFTGAGKIALDHKIASKN
ncbi:Bifunctional phosphoribosylaminoimidazolecarboxamide formyltransferase/IMP cyclohydrolase [Bibersteinia trehalosi USDA-ARS-USMARC-188]|uniref:Bifunctional phosphoribosylaminoimidazolecarboxamide formyltransferase/IMP cyclohydrolase n=3 Tax=Bibersteinia trehalosi TaxID=47735 RepID=A0A4V7I8P6_BIBTR|nr:DoxX family protein [Bibersteinia trehalosi]AGH38804.1 Bifunctional phosphoribosylaminoimidazolecarboxamide formyltransferase/IMP cyclohydrolase [Bibersteinia trehalosi USDA-ARS-USMARC-192]AHG81397.1 Bifunctional phosphoribosylaminoimidazolecarboxamide formyltransferase/IMP cyclohydrolase [Bibersteinia trehalosi USDA-ARS-USMARC-188]AHG83663.1 Bifunctional phosphoribosylaminoimidazolecarboxamide formyltransferase/IMP cyclohydrolase [Bibersteinia trehalosi USDA-ARS-USMARC-189]RRN04535.1 DoxX f